MRQVPGYWELSGLASRRVSKQSRTVFTVVQEPTIPHCGAASGAIMAYATRRQQRTSRKKLGQHIVPGESLLQGQKAQHHSLGLHILVLPNLGAVGSQWLPKIDELFKESKLT